VAEQAKCGAIARSLRTLADAMAWLAKEEAKSPAMRPG
jgi:hypothetical protein